MSQQLRQQHYQGRDTAARLQDARAIEKSISELGQTFQKMAGLVAAQSEVRGGIVLRPWLMQGACLFVS